MLSAVWSSIIDVDNLAFSGFAELASGIFDSSLAPKALISRNRQDLTFKSPWATAS